LIVDIRFARRASVGLMVRAPSPDACDVEGIPGIVDILLDDDEGVSVPLPLGRPGDLPANEEDLECSGVDTGAER
jgi:hypothetical protein